MAKNLFSGWLKQADLFQAIFNCGFEILAFCFPSHRELLPVNKCGNKYDMWW
jgi:hypothetical protein